MFTNLVPIWIPVSGHWDDNKGATWTEVR